MGRWGRSNAGVKGVGSGHPVVKTKMWMPSLN